MEDAIERVLEGKIARREVPELARRITQIAVSEQFSGPMPHPKHFREYDTILPGSAERMLAMVEKNMDHNMQMDKEALRGELADRKLGMIVGAVLFGLLIVGAFASLFVTTNPVVPGLFLGASVVGGIVAFIKGRNGK
jgi:uncharacterized membrane protein